MFWLLPTETGHNNQQELCVSVLGCTKPKAHRTVLRKKKQDLCCCFLQTFGMLPDLTKADTTGLRKKKRKHSRDNVGLVLSRFVSSRCRVIIVFHLEFVAARKIRLVLGSVYTGCVAFTNAVVCVATQGVASQHHDAGIDHWSIPASPTQAPALVNPTRPVCSDP